MNRLMERVPFLEKYGYWLPLVFGVCAVAQCLSSYFQLDDFAIICALRYDYPEPINWFAVWPSGFWRPFQLAVLWSEIRLFGSSPAGYRIVHGIYFLLAIYLYHRLTERVSGSRTTGRIAGLLFASTYSHWEAVQWICASSELWTGLWCLVMLTAFLNVRDTHQPAWIGAAITAHTLALLTKESAVVLLPISLLLLYHQQALAMLKRPWFILGILAPWLASLLWRIKLTITGGAVNDGLYSLSGNHPIHNLGAFVLRKIVPWIHAPSMLEALGVVVVLGITLSILWNRRATLPLIGSLWMLLGLAPFLGFNLAASTPAVIPI